MKINNIKQVVNKRVSTRDYDISWNDTDAIEKVILFCNSIQNKKGPFGTNINIDYINSNNLDGDIKLGTYGMIKGSKHYLVVSVNKSNYNLIDLGYLFEEVVLYLTSLGLGNVWMAGTYNKNDFAEVMNFTDDREIIIVCPFGLAASKKSILSKLVTKSKVRKEFNELFMDINLNPLISDKVYMKALEMVRLAPSSMNKQHWRIVVDEENKLFHFYSALEKEGSDMNIGIALAHFELFMNENGITGTIINDSNEILENYKFTWKQN